MKYRNLGLNGMSVSEIGFGSWGIGGNSYGDVDDAESERALIAAFDKGVNFYDTSNIYGSGHSEELLGKVFEKRRDRILIATKGGTLPHSGFHMPQNFSVKHLRGALTESLKRLRTDYVDLYQMHSPELKDIENPELKPFLEGLKKEGLIRQYGISVRSPADGIAAIEKYKYPVVQVNFNMIDQRALDNGLFELAKKNGTGIINRTPLVFGYLSGKLTGDEKFKGIDHRANWPKEQLHKWAESPNLFKFLYENKPRTAVQAALLFCLSFDAVSTVIPGMMNVKEVMENTGASSMPPLSPEEKEKVLEIYKTHDFYDKGAKKRGKQ